MLAVLVSIEVHAEQIEAFRAATVDNARHSREEPGIARFDVVQQQDDPTRFLLVEVYRTLDAPARHKETAHYARWRDAVAPMMAAPRQSRKFETVYPDDAAW
jgi:autoinducer 2-degrading protein